MKFDLRERTSRFAVRLIKLIEQFPRNTAGVVLGKQLIRAGTSIGANLEEADAASSRKDFFYKISLSSKEAKETKYWLNLIINAEILINNETIQAAKSLLQESHELASIFCSIMKKR